MEKYWEANIDQKARRAGRREANLRYKARKAVLPMERRFSWADPQYRKMIQASFMRGAPVPFIPRVYEGGKWITGGSSAILDLDIRRKGVFVGSIDGLVREHVINPHITEWAVGPDEVPTIEITDAYNELVRSEQIPEGTSLRVAIKSPEMKAELFRRGVIQKEFAPAGRIYDDATAQILPRPGSEIASAAKAAKEYSKGLQRFESKLMPEVSQIWESKLQKLSEAERREVVASFKGYYKVPGMDTIISPQAVEKQVLIGSSAEMAAEQQAGRVSYMNQLDIGRVTSKEIRPDYLSKEIARQHIRTGAFASENNLLKRGVLPTEINALAAFGGEKKVYTKLGYELPGTATARYLPGQAGEERLFMRLTPRAEISGEVPVDLEEFAFGKGSTAADQIETQAVKLVSARRKRVIIRERDGAASAFYSSKPRPAALRRARGREATKVKDARLARDRTLAVPVGKPYGPTAPDLRSLRRTRRLARQRAEAIAPGVGRATTQASASLTAINQSIKESALLPDIVRPELVSEGLIPAGKTKLTLRPYDLTDDLLAKYPGTTKGIDILLGSKKIGVVPYRGRGGMKGGTINQILRSERTAAYLESSGRLAGGQPWGKVRVLQELRPGKISKMARFRVAGSTLFDFDDLLAGQSMGETASTAANFEGSQAVKNWMAKVPTKWKVGAGIIGVAMGAMLLSRMNKRPPEILQAGERPDSSLYGGARASMMSPEGMDEENYSERIRDRMEDPIPPMSYATRIEDPNSIQTNIRIRSGTKRSIDFEAIGRGIGLTASERSGAELGNVNVRVTDDSRTMSDQYMDRKIARLI